MFKRILFLCLLFGSSLWADERLRVISFSDFHGSLIEKQQFDGEKTIGIWGPSEFSAVIQALRQEWKGRSLLVTNGDDFQGTLLSNLVEGRAVIDYYNYLGVFLSNLGNHEFDYGPIGPNISTPHTRKDDPLGALRQRMKEADHDYVTANIRRADGRLLDLPRLNEYKIEKIASTAVGFLGLITPRTPSLTISRNVERIQFTSMTQETMRLVPAMRKDGARPIIVLAHAGANCSGSTEDTCPPSEEIVQYANSLPPGYVDLIISGHSHTFLNMKINGIPVVQTVSNGRGIAVSDFLIKDDGSVRLNTRVMRLAEMKEFIGEKRDEAVQALLRPYYDQTRQLMEEIIGELAVPLTRAGSGDSAMGAFVADRMRESISSADMALINQGGLRADLPRGRITYGQVYDVMPFDNKIVSVRLRGSQLKELIKLATSGGHGWMHFSGVTITLDPKRDIEKPPALRNRVVHVEFTDGSPIRNSKTYTVVTNDFLLQGGDGLGEFFEKIPEARKRITDVIVREYIADWFRERKNQGPLKCVPEGTRVNLL